MLINEITPAEHTLIIKECKKIISILREESEDKYFDINPSTVYKRKITGPDRERVKKLPKHQRVIHGGLTAFLQDAEEKLDQVDRELSRMISRIETHSNPSLRNKKQLSPGKYNEEFFQRNMTHLKNIRSKLLAYKEFFNIQNSGQR